MGLTWRERGKGKGGIVRGEIDTVVNTGREKLSVDTLQPLS